MLLFWLCLFSIKDAVDDLPGCNLHMTKDVKQIEIGEPWNRIILSGRGAQEPKKDGEARPRPSQMCSQGKLLRWGKDGVTTVHFHKM